MHRILALVAVLSLGSTACGAAGVNLHLNDCGAGSSASSVSNACVVNSGTAFTAVGSVVLPPLVGHQFAGVICVLDLQSAAAQVPDWWNWDRCHERYGSLTLVTDAGMGGSCPTLWDAVAPAGNNITLDPYIRGLNRMRILLGALLDAANAYDLVGDGTTEWSVFRLSVSNNRASGLGECGGCEAGACIVLNEVTVVLMDNFCCPHPLRLTTPISGNYLVYNTGGPGCPAATPARNRTWGSVKAMYR